MVVIMTFTASRALSLLFIPFKNLLCSLIGKEIHHLRKTKGPNEPLHHVTVEQ